MHTRVGFVFQKLIWEKTFVGGGGVYSALLVYLAQSNIYIFTV